MLTNIRLYLQSYKANPSNCTSEQGVQFLTRLVWEVAALLRAVRSTPFLIKSAVFSIKRPVAYSSRFASIPLCPSLNHLHRLPLYTCLICGASPQCLLPLPPPPTLSTNIRMQWYVPASHILVCQNKPDH